MAKTKSICLMTDALFSPVSRTLLFDFVATRICWGPRHIPISEPSKKVSFFLIPPCFLLPSYEPGWKPKILSTVQKILSWESGLAGSWHRWKDFGNFCCINSFRRNHFLQSVAPYDEKDFHFQRKMEMGVHKILVPTKLNFAYAQPLR